MAVPKQKQSHSRSTKRRSQHKMAAAPLTACPRCHAPRRPHRVCIACGHYDGVRVILEQTHDHDHG